MEESKGIWLPEAGSASTSTGGKGGRGTGLGEGVRQGIKSGTLQAERIIAAIKIA